MREIKFRGRKINSADWVYGDLRKTQNGNVGISVNGKLYIVYADTVGQFTGVTDLYSNEIYEGDIVKNAFKEEYKIVWDEKRCQFIAVTTIEDGSEWYQFMSRSFEIVGNIHEDKS